MNLKKVINRLFLSMTFVLNSLFCVQSADASEQSRVRLHMDIMMNAMEGAKTYRDWIRQMPFEKKSLKAIEKWFSKNGHVNDKIFPIRYHKDEVKISWQKNGDEPAGSFTLVSLQPIIFRLNEKEFTINDAHPTMDLLLKRLMEASKQERKTAGLWSIALPEAEAFEFKNIPAWIWIPLLVINVGGLVYAGKNIYDNYKKGEELSKRYDDESKAIADTKERVTKASSLSSYPYIMSDVNCTSVVGEEKGEKTNILAEKGEKGYKSNGLNRILLTPKGSEFGANDLEVKYSNYNGKTQIKEIRLRRKSDSSEGKAKFKNDCIMFSSAISAPNSKFISTCVDKAFPGQSINSLDDFYEKLGGFKLKDYEKMAATEPGCIQLSDWAANGTAVQAPVKAKVESTPVNKTK